MKQIKLKSRVALYYKVFLYAVLVSQIMLFFILFPTNPIMAVFNLILIIYFSVRIFVFTKVERRAKSTGMSIFDYMKRFEREHKNF